MADSGDGWTRIRNTSQSTAGLVPSTHIFVKEGTGSTGEDADASYRIPVFVDERSSNADYFKWVTHDDVVKTGRKSLSV